MSAAQPFELAPVFARVAEALRGEQAALNQADPVNGNHGDHMVAIFEIAAQAAAGQQGAGLAAAMETAGRMLADSPGNGSAQVYARGLEQLARQLRRREVGLEDLARYARGVLQEKAEQKETPEDAGAPAREQETLKALLAGLANWQQVEKGLPPEEQPLDMGYLFDVGVAYLQAKQRGGEKIQVLADAAASASPLSGTPHRYRSGKLAIEAFLRALVEMW